MEDMEFLYIWMEDMDFYYFWVEDKEFQHISMSSGNQKPWNKPLGVCNVRGGKYLGLE